MRTMVLLGCLVASAVSGLALTSVTADQLEQRIAADHSRSDSDLAGRLRNLELTQRLSTPRLQKLQAAMPGQESRDALTAIADLSAVLDPPANEIPTDSAPSAAEQQRMLANAQEASDPSSVDRMPEFDATMILSRFRNLKYLTGDFSEPIPLVLPVPLFLNRDTDGVTHREGRLIITHISQKWAPGESLKTGVENWEGLYAVLANVLRDLREARPEWVRWEQGPADKLAVFRFAVEQKQAHFSLRTWMNPQKKLGFDGHPGYRAEIALDPATGAMHRLVLRAAIDPGQHVSRADVVVEFASANVQSKSFLCPLRAISIGVSESILAGYDGNFVAFDAGGSFNSKLGTDIRPLTHLTDVEFENYRAAEWKPLAVTNRAYLEAAIRVKGEQVNAQQLEKIVAGLQGMDDRGAVERLGKIELTQRLTADRFKRLRELLPDKASSDALLALCNLAEFEHLPAADLAEGVIPDASTQGKILIKAADFVARVMHKMPDLFAARQLVRFEDLRVERGVPQPMLVETKPLAVVDQSIGTVHFREGKEVIDAETKSAGQKPFLLGLDSKGTFGPILEIVTTDSLKAKIGWSHWERGPAGRLAVFRYAVPQDLSHINVRYCCYLGEDGLPLSYEAKPSYHGELAIDPQTGAVLRLVIKAEVRPNAAAHTEQEVSPLLRADVLEEYGPVEIAGKQYITPQRAVTVMTSWTLGGQGPLSKPMSKREGAKAAKKALELMEFSRVNAINEAVFRDYHVFRSEVRVVADPADGVVDAPKQ